MLDNEHDSELLSQAASILAQDHPKGGVGRVEIGKVDGFEETRRGREGDRRGRCYATSCGEDNGKAGCQDC